MIFMLMLARLLPPLRAAAFRHYASLMPRRHCFSIDYYAAFRADFRSH